MTNTSITLSSSPENIRKVEDFILDFCESNNLEDSTTGSLMIAVTEAANNAILHGNKSNPDKEVEIHIIPSETDLVIKVKDQGNGFDPAKIPDPLADENLLKTSGRGVFIMKNIMKKVDYEFNDGTTVIMTFDIATG